MKQTSIEGTEARPKFTKRSAAELAAASTEIAKRHRIRAVLAEDQALARLNKALISCLVASVVREDLQPIRSKLLEVESDLKALIDEKAG